MTLQPTTYWDCHQLVEIANVLVFLAADKANCITGTTIAAGDGFMNFNYPLLD